MNYQLEHVAIYPKDIARIDQLLRKILWRPRDTDPQGSAGYGFCFVRIAGSPSIQLMESADKIGVHHYGYVTDDIDQVARDLEAKGAQILRENRDAEGKLTTIFVKDPNGLEIEIRSPR